MADFVGWDSYEEPDEGGLPAPRARARSSVVSSGHAERSRSNSVVDRLKRLFRLAKEDPDLEDLDLGITRYTPVSLEVLVKSTKFSRKEIQLIYRGFKQDCPTGVVSADKFRELYSQFFPLGDATTFSKQIFQLMDQDMDGNVSFEEFLVVMSMLSRGSLEEKLQWVFNLYDLRGEGFLTQETLVEIGVSIYDMLGKYTDPPVHESTIREHVARVFLRMDADSDGMVTFSEFKEFCVNDEKVRHNFCVFNCLL